jgi:plasmid stabilization system protein ParE
VRAVYQALDVICEAPHAWPRWPAAPGRIPPIRRFLLTRFPYAIACQAHERVITVLAVVHGKRRPFYWVGRQT